jgi:hypothetical protein
MTAVKNASAAPAATSLSLSPTLKYIALIFLLFGSVVLALVNKVIPLDVLYPGIGSILVALFGFLAHDLSEAHTPNGWPSWTTYLVVTIASAIYGGVGLFTKQTFMESGATVTWLIVVFGFIFHQLAEDQGVKMPANAEAWATAFLGIFLSALIWWSSNQTAGVNAFVAALAVIVPTYIHSNGDGSFSFVPNPPDPTATTSETKAKE